MATQDTYHLSKSKSQMSPNEVGEAEPIWPKFNPPGYGQKAAGRVL